MMNPFDEEEPAVILELKYAKEPAQLEAGGDKALAQIEERRYADELAESGCSGVMKYGICFYKKNCRVKGKMN